MDITDIWKYDLREGSTDHPRNGACLFDAGMWLVYGRIGDNPPCACPIIRYYAIGLNDLMPDALRSKLLKPYILRVVGNRDPKAEPDRLRYIILETTRRVVSLVCDIPEFMALRHLPDDASFKQIEIAAEVAAKAATWTNARGVAWALIGAAEIAAKIAASTDRSADISSTHIFATIIRNAAEAIEIAEAVKATVITPDYIWEIGVSILDGALRIGKQSPEFDETKIRRAAKEFELASQS